MLVFRGVPWINNEVSTALKPTKKWRKTVCHSRFSRRETPSQRRLVAAIFGSTCRATKSRKGVENSGDLKWQWKTTMTVYSIRSISCWKMRTSIAMLVHWSLIQSVYICLYKVNDRNDFSPLNSYVAAGSCQKIPAFSKSRPGWNLSLNDS